MKDEGKNNLLYRTKQFALRILKLADNLPKTNSGNSISKQVTRSGTSVAANYRAAQRARSRNEFVAKIRIVLEEVDETLFWLELLTESGIVAESKLKLLLKEANELTAIFCSISKSSSGFSSIIHHPSTLN